MLSKLKQLRLERGYSIEDISDRLNIRRQYLIDLEEENFDALPGKIYVEGYIKIYSKFLGVDIQDLNMNVNNSGEAENIVKDNGALSNLKWVIKYQKYFITASIISLIIIFFSYNIVRSDNYSGIGTFKEIIAQKFTGNKYKPDVVNKIDYTVEDLYKDDILELDGMYIDQSLTEEDNMIIKKSID